MRTYFTCILDSCAIFSLKTFLKAFWNDFSHIYAADIWSGGGLKKKFSSTQWNVLIQGDAAVDCARICWENSGYVQRCVNI